MFANWKNKTVMLYNNYGKIIRQFTVAAEVVDAAVSGAGKDAVVAITMKDGKTVLYKSNGQVVRRV